MKALLLLSGGFDSPIAGLLVQKRMDLLAVHFSFEPLTSGEPEEKSRELAKLREIIEDVIDPLIQRFFFIFFITIGIQFRSIALEIPDQHFAITASPSAFCARLILNTDTYLNGAWLLTIQGQAQLRWNISTISRCYFSID